MEILLDLRRMGKTIFISSHILSELAMLCDHVTIIDRGTVKFSGAMKNLLARNGSTPTYVIALAADHAPSEEAVRRLPGILGVAKAADAARYSVSFDGEQINPTSILQAVIAAGGQVVSFQEDVKHLNQAFMDLTEPGVPPVLPESAQDIKNAV
jgi:ABC-2 type transport system ATP-binding protein